MSGTSPAAMSTLSFSNWFSVTTQFIVTLKYSSSQRLVMLSSGLRRCMLVAANAVLVFGVRGCLAVRSGAGAGAERDSDDEEWHQPNDVFAHFFLLLAHAQWHADDVWEPIRVPRCGGRARAQPFSDPIMTPFTKYF